MKLHIHFGGEKSSSVKIKRVQGGPWAASRTFWLRIFTGNYGLRRQSAAATALSHDEELVHFPVRPSKAVSRSACHRSPNLSQPSAGSWKESFNSAPCETHLRARTSPVISGFTVIELIGILAIIAILAVVAVTTIMKRVDQAAWTKETVDLKAIADSYTQFILRNKIIPGTNTWASSVASQMSLPVGDITSNARRLARAFLIDPNLNIGGAGLPYTQTTNGAAKPVSARVMIVSSLARALPISTGTPSSTEFNAIWDTAEGAKPSTSTWTSWAGNGEDLRIKKLNLEPLFYQLILIDHDAVNTALFSIDSTSTAAVPTTGLGWNSYYLDGTVVGLNDCNGVLQTRYLLKRSISFIFESCAWSGAIQGGQPMNPSALEFLNHATTFMSKPLSPDAVASGSSQFSVLLAVYTFMYDYTLWANECPHFDNHGKSGNSIPEYKMLNDQGQNSGNIDTFSTGLVK